MKKKYSVIFLSILTILFMSSCNILGKQSENISDKIEVGVIETNGSTKKSAITFYDKDLNKVEELRLRYATLGDMFCNPVVYKGNLYVIPLGYDNRQDEKKVLEINLSNFEKKTYKIDQIGMYGLTVDDENIYTCTNLNFNSYISKCDRKTGEVEQIEIEDIYVTQVFSYQGNLYAFATKMYPEKTKENRKKISYLYIYDSELKLIDKVNLSQYGDLQDKVTVFEDKIYFSNTHNDETELPNDTVCAYSVKDKKIEKIQLEKKYPLDLTVYENNLIISHFNLIRKGEGSISFFNLETKEQKNYELGHAAEHMVRRGEYLYILSESDLYQYRIDGMKLEFIKEVEVEKIYEDNYFSTMFVVDNIVENNEI